MANTGQTGPKRSKFQRERDLQITTELYLKGKAQWQIAEIIGVSQDQIHEDLKLVRKAWLNSSLVDFDQKKQEELAKIDLLEMEYWAAWDRSKEEKSKTKSSKTRNGETSVSIEKEMLIGDPRFLQGVERCIEMRIKILGLYAPIKTDFVGKLEVSSATLIEAMRKGLFENGGKTAEIWADNRASN